MANEKSIGYEVTAKFYVMLDFDEDEIIPEKELIKDILAEHVLDTLQNKTVGLDYLTQDFNFKRSR